MPDITPPGKNNLNLPYVTERDTVRSTWAVVAQGMEILGNHTHPDLTVDLSKLEIDINLLITNTKKLLVRDCASFRTVTVQRRPKKDKTVYAPEVDSPKIDESLSIPLALHNPDVSTKSFHRFATVDGLGSGTGEETSTLIIVKTKKTLVEDDQDAGDDDV